MISWEYGLKTCMQLSTPICNLTYIYKQGYENLVMSLEFVKGEIILCHMTLDLVKFIQKIVTLITKVTWNKNPSMNFSLHYIRFFQSNNQHDSFKGTIEIWFQLVSLLCCRNLQQWTLSIVQIIAENL